MPHMGGNISRRNIMKRMILLSIVVTFYFFTGAFALFTVLALFDKGTTIGVSITFAIITILSYNLAKFISKKIPKKSPKTLSETINDLPKYTDIYFDTLKSYIKSIYLFSDDEVKEMIDFILTNYSDIRDTTAWEKPFYEKYLQPVQWEWFEFEELNRTINKNEYDDIL